MSIHCPKHKVEVEDVDQDQLDGVGTELAASGVRGLAQDMVRSERQVYI